MEKLTTLGEDRTENMGCVVIMSESLINASKNLAHFFDPRYFHKSPLK
jgi:hypothetical protein